MPCAREKFEKYIQSRGGVKVWENVNLSTPEREIFISGGTRVWKQESKAAVLDRRVSRTNYQGHKRLWFVKEMREVKRFHVAIRRGSQGFCFKCTDASSARIRRECAKIKAKTGEEPGYDFDYEAQECVIFQPVWED